MILGLTSWDWRLGIRDWGLGLSERRSVAEDYQVSRYPVLTNIS